MPDIRSLCIVKAAFGGYGLAFHEGKVIFVTGALPGETVTARITGERKNHAFAAALEILSPSPARIDPACPNFGRCGGCDYLNAAYDAELSMKRDIVIDSLTRIAKMPATSIPATETISGERFGYRTIASVKTGRDGTGFFRRGTNDLEAFPPGGCPLLWRPLREFCAASGAAPQEIKIAAGADGKLHNGRSGPAVLREHERGLVYDRSIRCFFQANRFLRGAMIDTVAAMAQAGHGERFLDLACGVGYFTVPLGKRTGSGEGYDIDTESVRWARTNADTNGVGGVKFSAGDIASVNPRGGSFGAVVLDPPRTGLTSKAVRAVSAIGAPRIVYVSCDPATFARDCAWLLKAGYIMERLVMIDMFPATYHIETIAYLTRERNGATAAFD